MADQKVERDLPAELHAYFYHPDGENLIFREKIEIFPKFCFFEELWTFSRRMSSFETLYDKSRQFW